MKPLVLISSDTMNVPEEVSATLKPMADVTYVKAPYDELLQKARALLVGGEKVNEEYLRKAPKLGIAARFGVGYDSVDVEACTRRKVYVTHTPDVLSGAVADHTWALILGFMRRIPEADRNVREHWAKRDRRLAFGWDMEGKTLGILGLGRIGTEVLKRAQGFNVDLAYNDVVRREALEKRYGVRRLSFDELLEASDILSIHVPLLPSTRGIIGDEALSKMKATAVVVNTSRGQVIDEKALYRALRERRIRGAALDVFEEEPTPLDNPLLTLDNMVVTPHCASATWETRRKMAETAVGNIKAFLEGRRPPNVVPEQRGVSF
ncbi:MAG TPA: D-glycerate dehydrogenase [Candidatus Desulfaltia sp.]|nr:D-glycerate dehydrogenase [Candidatus Desulfaltia sp.]